MAYVYRHIRLDKNEPFYIGIGSDENGKYIRANNINKRNKFWKNITNKTKYRVEILFDDLSLEEAKEKEKEFISLYGRKNLKLGTLCNLTDGGDGAVGLIVTKETRKKIADSERGELNYFYGKQLSEEHRDKISKGLQGKKKSFEHIINMSKSRIGKKVGFKHEGSKIVLDLSTGIYYECAREASEIFNVKYSTLRCWLNGANKNKSELIYV